jgi:hypothetical protein
MARRRGKNISFDAMVKFFMQTYEIPTKKDVERLMERLDRLEKLLKSSGAKGRGRTAARKKKDRGGSRPRSGTSAVDQVFETIKEHKDGAGLVEIKEKTGFDDKKIRNILFRLFKAGQIKRINRGIYSV